MQSTCAPVNGTAAATLLPPALRFASLSQERLHFCPTQTFVSLKKACRMMSSARAAAAAAGGSTETVPQEQETKLWGGRFEKPVTNLVERFGESVSFDKKLYKQDIQGSRAHAQMLAKQGLLTDEDCATIHTGLEEIEKKIENGEFVWRLDREDVHMNIEATLTELVGEPAKKLHTARSRNDQVVTDVRLWCRDAIDQLLNRIHLFQVSIVKLAVANEGTVVPGYTHLQRAQPLLLQHLLLAYVEQLERDAGRLIDCRARVNFSPLGSCALAGTGLPIDRFQTAEALGFTAPLRNSVDGVSDRDFILELLAANAIIGVHLSRLAEEWVLWTSEEFGFMTASDAVSTGSSIMPQKKNPDPMEIVRGKSGRLIGDLTTVLVVCKGLPQAFNRDLQEDKEPLFDSVKTTIDVLEVCAEFAENVTFNKERLVKSLSAGHLDATTMADYLVYKGIPFRTSHDIVGRSVALAVSKRVELSQLSLEEYKSINPIIEEDVYTFLGSENAISKFQSYGSTGAGPVAEQIKYWRQKLGL